ncbi:hypothetical protein cypCar_00049289 [Cyprinus carpio]|nr:hypothetical protein cypCar_00049289 [Cyprinus carpio]
MKLVRNLNQNPRTLLPKFFGLYCVQSGGKNIRIVVMNNILPRIVRMHLKFDLKGSTYKRRASKKEREKSKPTFKDLDFMQDVQDGLLLDVDTMGGIPAVNGKGERLLLFIGIIDILQSYRSHTYDNHIKSVHSESTFQIRSLL